MLDEHGAVAGIVTPEDILEEIAGEIADEFDFPDARVTRIDKRTHRVAGSMTIDDFNETLGTQLPQDDARTLAGLVLNGLGRRPDPGDTLTVAHVEIQVESIDGLRVTGLRITLPE